MSIEKCYSTDLSDAEWECLQLHVPAPNKRGGLRAHSKRELLNAIFHVLKSGCPWRLQPKDFPPWETVYSWFGRWRVDGTFERLRSRLGRNPLPSTGIADSQSSNTTGVGGEQGGTTGTRRFEAGNGTYWRIPKGWFSKPRFTARRSQTRTG